YYVVANIFKNPRNLGANLKKLRNKGFPSGSIFDGDKGLNYVYLERFDHWEDALKACSSHFQGAYTKEKWMMIVEPDMDMPVSPHSVEPDGMARKEIPLEEITYEMLTSQENMGPSANRDDLLYRNPLVMQADGYFDTMRYAEAAE